MTHDPRDTLPPFVRPEISGVFALVENQRSWTGGKAHLSDREIRERTSLGMKMVDRDGAA